MLLQGLSSTILAKYTAGSRKLLLLLVPGNFNFIDRFNTNKVSGNKKSFRERLSYGNKKSFREPATKKVSGNRQLTLPKYYFIVKCIPID